MPDTLPKAFKAFLGFDSSEDCELKQNQKQKQKQKKKKEGVQTRPRARSADCDPETRKTRKKKKAARKKARGRSPRRKSPTSRGHSRTRSTSRVHEAASPRSRAISRTQSSSNVLDSARSPRNSRATYGSSGDAGSETASASLGASSRSLIDDDLVVLEAKLEELRMLNTARLGGGKPKVKPLSAMTGLRSKTEFLEPSPSSRARGRSSGRGERSLHSRETSTESRSSISLRASTSSAPGMDNIEARLRALSLDISDDTSVSRSDPSLILQKLRSDRSERLLQLEKEEEEEEYDSERRRKCEAFAKQYVPPKEDLSDWKGQLTKKHASREREWKLQEERRQENIIAARAAVPK